MRTAKYSLLLCLLPLAAMAEDAQFDPLAKSMAKAVRNRDLVRFAKCYPETSEILEHLQKTMDAGITMAMVNKKFGDRHKKMVKSYEELLKKADKKGMDVDSVKVASVSTSGPRPKVKEMNVLKIILQDQNGKTLVVRLGDLIQVNGVWLVGGGTTAASE